MAAQQLGSRGKVGGAFSPVASAGENEQRRRINGKDEQSPIADSVDINLD